MASDSAPDTVRLDPWERQADEPEAAYEAFKGYLLQNPPRRLAHASVRHGAAALSRLFNTYAWSERVLAYDRHVERVRREEREALLRQDAKERAAADLALLQGVHDVLSREIAKLVRDSQATEAFGIVKVSDLNKLLGRKIELERLIHGESTENIGVTVDMSKLSIEELKELQRLQAKMAGPSEDE